MKTKFRIAYTAQDGSKTIHYDDNRYLIGLNGEIYKNYRLDWKTPVWEVPFDVAQPPVLHQYTNHEDNNGKDIYELDIVKCKRFYMPPLKEGSDGVWHGSSNDIVEMEEEIGIIFFSDVSYGWCVEFRRYDDIDDLSHYCASHRIEVVGNVFENADMVKGFQNSDW